MGGQGQRAKCQGLEVDETRNQVVFTSACCGNVSIRRLTESELDGVEEWWAQTSGMVEQVKTRTLQGYLRLQNIVEREEGQARSKAEGILNMMRLLVCGMCQTWRNPPTRVVTVVHDGEVDNFNACAVCGDCIACAIDLIALLRSFASFKGFSQLDDDTTSDVVVLCSRVLLFFTEQKDTLKTSRQGEFDPNQLFLYSECPVARPEEIFDSKSPDEVSRLNSELAVANRNVAALERELGAARQERDRLLRKLEKAKGDVVWIN